MDRKLRYLRLFASIGLVAVMLALVLSMLTQRRHWTSVIRSRTSPVAAGASRVSPLIRSLRPAYPYSVIPGGVYSGTELLVQLKRDWVAARHYAGFDVKQARLEPSSAERFVYVSYRKQDQIFWTNRKLRIPKGELLVTDGKSYARARCGNRLSETPQTPAPPVSPMAELTLPPVSPGMLRDPRITFAAPPDIPGPPIALVPMGPLPQPGAPPLEGMSRSQVPIIPPVTPGVYGGAPFVPLIGPLLGSSEGNTPSQPQKTTTGNQPPPTGLLLPLPPPPNAIPEPPVLILAGSGFGVLYLYAARRARRLGGAQRS